MKIVTMKQLPRLLFALVCMPPLYAMELPVSSAQNVRLIEHKDNLYVEDNMAAYRVAPHNMNRELREIIKHKALGKFKEHGYIRAHKQIDGAYTLAAHARGKGGGPILGAICYGAVKAVAYAGVAVMGVGAAAAVTAATGGTGTPVVIAASVAAKSAVGASMGAAMAGSVIAGTSAGAAAGSVATAGVATAGVTGFLAGVEAVALWAWALGSAAPTI